MWRFQSGK
ncbi:hypothetical protein CGLO_12209 [Colletotrichum gloeosporioides Cg-14]|uniref:Uncharacterized protein n=1 Tax=Colletotrichum gloeosporioides (strain Cg-14) TaxID=1237896 RepID=T0LK40_COLGC|nr:hypothetical protein CGLO_12209 [Colletotrichum gloeosporioides Cg-14]